MAPISYKSAGVDIQAGETLVERIKALARRTMRPEIREGIGGFAALFQVPRDRYRDPMLVASTDGVGTKLKVAQAAGRHETVGIDLVAMSANDVATVGAEPLAFLDYFATGALDLDTAEAVLRGVAEGCAQAGCALIGGETAEMPDLYGPGEYDLAGFLVGVVERDRIIDGRRIAVGDAVIGVRSKGLHSNGFSLARRVFFDAAGWALDRHVPELGRTLGEELLTPTRIYVRTLAAVLEAVPVRGIAHITGGGLPGNVPRILPEGCAVRLRRSAWTPPPIFGLIQRLGPVDPEEMYRVFNMGIGLVLIARPEDADPIAARAGASGDDALVIGEVVPGNREVIWA